MLVMIIILNFAVLRNVWLFTLSVSSDNIPPTLRQTSNGPVEGIEKISSLGQKYYSFRGIPFAEAPITGTDPYTGEYVDRRFKAPEVLKRLWINPLKVQEFEKICPQIKMHFPADLSKMGEDCLFLNVHVPAGGAKQKTVLVWFHGGAWNTGDGTDYLFGPDFLLSQDNIVVTIQSRLGIFGFLNLKFGEYTGNMALKDQQLALKWIHENIGNFSGNNSEILIFGESAGGDAVHFHMLNKESRSYFQRVFAASGTALTTNAITKVNHVQQLRECWKINEMDKLIEYLKTESSDTLIKCPQLEILVNLNRIWAPVVESNDTEGAFLTKTPREIYSDPNEELPFMDTMFSITSQEVSLELLNITASEGSEPLIKENVMETTRIDLPFKGFTKAAYPKEFEEALKKLRKAYFSNKPTVDAIKRTNSDLLSDARFNYATIRSAVLQANANHRGTTDTERKNTFLFRFNVTTDLNLMSIIAKKKLSDAAHLDDICYLFHCHYLDEIKLHDKHLEQKDLNYELIMRFVKMITNFARNGDPSIEDNTPFKSINSVDEIFCQEIANELKTGVTNDIRQQIHYDVWREIEETFIGLNL